MPDSASGINISLREIYDMVKEISDDVKELSPKIHKLEGDMSELKTVSDMAKEAHRLATKHDESFKWLWRTTIGALVTALVGAVMAVIIFGIQMGIKQQINNEQVPAVVEVQKEVVK